MTGFSDAEKLRRYQAHKQALIDHLFNAGYGHLDEPRLTIHRVSFYPSDLLPAHRAVLQQKIAAARSSRDLGLSINKPVPGIHWPDRDALYQQVQALPDGDEAGIHQLIADYGERILSAFESGDSSVFDPELLRNCKQHQHAFSTFLNEAPIQLLEYAVRTQLHLHLSSDFDPSTRQVPQAGVEMGQRGLYQRVCNEAGDCTLHEVTTGGIGQKDRARTVATFCHETAHAVIEGSTAQQQQQWNQVYDTFLQALAYSLSLPPSTPIAALREAALHDQTDPIHAIIAEEAFPLPEPYETPEEWREEIFANLLQSAVRGNGADMKKALAQQVHPPSAAAFADLLEATRTLFDQQIQTLRLTPLPQSAQQPCATTGR